jgi:hypothetical protein
MITMIEWTENLNIRRRAYQGRYAWHLLRALFVWAIWSVVIVSGLTWRMGNLPWSRHGIGIIAFVGGCSLLVRLIMEFNPRKVWLNERVFRIHHIKYYSCPLDKVSNVNLSPAGSGIFSLRLEARARQLLSKRTFVIGLDEQTAKRVRSFLGDGRSTESESSHLPPDLRHCNRPGRSNVIYVLYVRMLGWLCIISGVAIGATGLLEGISRRIVPSLVIAAFAIAIGVSVVRGGILVRIYRRVLNRGCQQK